MISEKDTFLVHYARGDKDIEKMYDALRDQQKQNVFVMTTDKEKEDIKKYINSDNWKRFFEKTRRKGFVGLNFGRSLGIEYDTSFD